MAVMDIYMIYQFIKKLVTPFTEMPAYHAGLIDGNGKFLKQRAQFTPAEQNICTYFDILIINLKRLIAMVPGGKSKLANYAAALFLTRTYESYQQNPHNVLFNLEEEFHKTLNEVYELYEDARAAVVSAGKASTSYIQRKLGVGYSRAAKLMDMLEERGVIVPANGSKPREVIGASDANTEPVEPTVPVETE